MFVITVIATLNVIYRHMEHKRHLLPDGDTTQECFVNTHTPVTDYTTFTGCQCDHLQRHTLSLHACKQTIA